MQLGPNNPFKTQQMAAPRNMLSGYAEPTHINDFMFEQQRRTFATYGYALDPSIDIQETATKYIGSVDDAEKNQGHSKAVRDICFNNAGTQFLSAAYDRYLKLWDTETGQCISRFTNRKVPYCVKFNPDEDKQSLLVAGMSDKKIVQWDIRSGEIVQEYDRHLGAVNTITFVDENRRFVSTSDDKSLRVWEWDIPVDFKYIAEPSMHSMPAVTLSPNGKWLACHSMDNQILIFGAQNRFRLIKRIFSRGIWWLAYLPNGKLNIWDWKTTKLYSK
ncbi:hypothetical protein FKM82_010940 [Ascaphus truei]